MIKVSLIWFLVVLIFLIHCSPILAVTITINNFPSSIDSADPFQLSASISGAVNATNYLRADLFKEGSTNYFGETFNGSDWYAGSDGKSYFPIQIQNASASATFQAQLGNPSASQYPGPGIYKLRLRRYTSSGSVASNDTQIPIDIQINYTFLTPTPEPTQTPRPETPSSSTSSTTSPTVRPTPTPTKNPIPSKTPTKSSTPTPFETAIPSEPTFTPIDSPFPEVLGVKDVSESKVNNAPKIAGIFITSGILLVGVSAYLAWKKTKI